MSRCWECDRYATKFTVIDGHHYCDKCAPDALLAEGYREMNRRVGTISIDPETGDHVMPPDFPGDVELRWPPDPAPAGDGAGRDDYRPVPHDAEVTARIDAVIRDHSTSETTQEDVLGANGSADYQTKRDLSVPLAEQIAQYGERCEEVLDMLYDNLEDEGFRAEIIRLGGLRLIENYAIYGSAMYEWGEPRRTREMCEEVADWTVMGTSGPFFDMRSAR